MGEEDNGRYSSLTACNWSLKKARTIEQPPIKTQTQPEARIQVIGCSQAHDQARIEVGPHHISKAPAMREYQTVLSTAK